MKNYLILALALAMLLIPAAMFADIFAKTGTAGLQFLKIGIDARAIGMGEAYTAVTDDISSAYWNPAGLASSKQQQILVSHTEWLADIRYEYFAYSTPTELGTFAFSGAMLHMGYMDVTDEEHFEATGETFTSYDMSAGISYANSFTESFQFGATAKFLHEHLDEYNVYGFAVDLGTLYNTQWNNVTVGMSLRNFGPNLQYEIDEDNDGSTSEDPFDLLDNDGDGLIDEDKEELDFKIPMNFSLGIAGDFLRTEESHLIGSLQLDNCVDRKEVYSVGFEYKIRTLKIRSGYQFEYDAASFSAGLGWTVPTRFAVIDLDYSYTDMGDLTESFLETAHRVSIKFAF